MHKMSMKPWIRIVAELSLDGHTTIGVNKSSRTFFSFQSPEVKHFTHVERAKFDAVMVGANTIRIDNPFLTVRAVKKRSPIRIVVSSRGELPLSSHIFTDGHATLLVVSEACPILLRHKYMELGIELLVMGRGSIDFEALMLALYKKGIKNLIVEGGAKILTKLCELDLIDELIIKTIPIIVGDGRAPTLLSGQQEFNIRSVKRMHLEKVTNIGDVIVGQYVRRKK